MKKVFFTTFMVVSVLCTIIAIVLYLCNIEAIKEITVASFMGGMVIGFPTLGIADEINK